MTPRFILITTATILLAGCDRRSAEVDAAKTAEISAQRQAEQAANDKIRQLEERLNAADQQKAADREAELARVKEELAQIKKDKDAAAERIRELQNEAEKPAPAPIAEAPARDADEPRGEAIRADLERVVEEDYEDDNVPESDPVDVGRVVPETQRVTNVESFYEPLDQYGDWIQTDDYGYVFRPEVSRRHDWKPYTDGRWIHTGHGWTWESNEDFGWATYHYGRWTRVERTGWVWVPGREWGPGWVSWRRGKEECGWAPLPPESRGRHNFTASVDRDYDIGPSAYVFIALSNFGARSYAPVIERPERNVSIINKTVNVTNITYNNTTNKTVVFNGGPNYDIVRARSKQPVENVKVNFAPQPPAGDRRKIVNLRQGNTFQIAPPPVAVAGNTAPARVKERLGKTKEDKGWAGVDPTQAKKVKQEILATSTERPRRPRPPGGGGNPNATRPVTPVVATPPNAPARPERPVNPAAEPVKPLQVAPRPETPTRPAVVEKPKALDPDAGKPVPVAGVPPKIEPNAEPKKPVEAEPPKMRETKPAPDVSPKPEQPEEPKKPVANEPPKMREPAPDRPAASPEPPVKLDRSDEPKRPDDNEPRRVREVESPATPSPVRGVPQRRETQPEPVTRERPKALASPEAPARPRGEPPAKVKAPAEPPARVRPAPAQEPAARESQPERRRVAPVPVTKPVVQQAPPPPVRRVVQPERPPQSEVRRAPESRVNRSVQQEPPREQVQRQAPPAPVMPRPSAPVVQRGAQPQVLPKVAQPEKSSEETDKRRKKDGGRD